MRGTASKLEAEKKTRHSRASAHLRAREKFHARVDELVQRMAAGDVIKSKDYAVETGCTLDEAKKAVSVARAFLVFVGKDPDVLTMLKASSMTAIKRSWGKPHETAKLLEPTAKIFGFVQSGPPVQVTLVIAERARATVEAIRQIIDVGARARVASRFLAAGQAHDASTAMAALVIDDVVAELVERAAEIEARMKGEEPRRLGTGGT